MHVSFHEFFFPDLICVLKHRPGFLFNLGTFSPHIEYYYFSYIYFISFLHKTYISALSSSFHPVCHLPHFFLSPGDQTQGLTDARQVL